MNVNLIKQKLAALQTRGNNTANKNKLSELIWKAPIGKFQVRIIPAKWDKENPFKEVFFHYGIGSRTKISLVNYGEKDPIVEFSQNLRKQYTPDNFKLSKKLEPKMRVFAPVIVRGEESKGVRLWEFGKEVYMELLAIAEDEDIQDYTDTYQGRDLVVETVGPEQSGRQFNKTSVRVKGKQSPASEDAQTLRGWLDNQPDPLEIYSKPTYEELKQILYEFLNPEESPSQEETTTTAPPAKEPVTSTPAPPATSAATKYTLNVKKPRDVEKEFEGLFDKEDDLPF